MPNVLQFLSGPVSKLLAAALGFVLGKLITAVPFVATLIGVDAADPTALAGWIDTAVEWLMTVGLTYFAPANTTKNA